MNRFFQKILKSLEDEIIFVNILKKLALKGEIEVFLNKDYISRPGKQKEFYIEIQILETPNRLIQFLIAKKHVVINSIYIYERPQENKNIYTHLHHTLSINQNDELNNEIALKVFKKWIEDIFNIDINVIIVDSK